jgi:hypothetical protein
MLFGVREPPEWPRRAIAGGCNCILASCNFNTFGAFFCTFCGD